MADLSTSAKELTKALSAVDKALRQYADAALAVGRESGDPTARGFSARQVRQRLQAHLIASLSPKRDSFLQFDGAPEARRYVASNPLPGLAP